MSGTRSLCVENAGTMRSTSRPNVSLTEIVVSGSKALLYESFIVASSMVPSNELIKGVILHAQSRTDTRETQPNGKKG